MNDRIKELKRLREERLYKYSIEYDPIESDNLFGLLNDTDIAINQAKKDFYEEEVQQLIEAHSWLDHDPESNKFALAMELIRGAIERRKLKISKL
ncbi:hypothetical protein [Elizabethkingia phage TCUEAP1]|nr:hypothetical protein [Elizabethkingia phage TCUEAP1]